MNNKEIAEKIREVLSESFINSEEVAHAIILGIVTRKNVLFYGPGGHGKSEMVMTALKAISKDIFKMSFGEGMSEDLLWGGLNFQKFDSEKIMEYFPERSFLAHQYAIFEEMFDAPSNVLLALKDTLTDRQLNKGEQKFSMRTEVVFGLTNRTPEEMEDEGLTVKALMERFPIRLEVKWESYTAEDYADMIHKRTGDSGEIVNIMAELLAKVAEDNEPISPRTAAYAYTIAAGEASTHGRDHIEKQDLLALKYLPGMESLAESLKAELDAAYERSQAEMRVKEAEEKLNKLIEEFENAHGPIRCLQMAKKFMAFGDEVYGLKVTDALSDRRKKIRDKASDMADKAKEKALDDTRA